MTQLPLDLPHLPALEREDFLVAACNRAAVAFLDRWPDWPAPALVIHGPAGCGKSHLAGIWRARTGAAAIEPSALRDLDPLALLADTANVALDFAAQDVPAPPEEEPLLHLYNLLAGRGGHLLICARGAPARWGIKLADLRSRLLAAPAVPVTAPDDDLLGALLVKLFADRQMLVGAEVLTYLLARMERSFAGARGLVEALDRASLVRQSGVTMALARAVLERQAERA
jgi:chromosomal replication initiation ATPase DnaA